VLGNKEKLISSSCATGPALEGAQLTFGMRAAPGAIERIKIDPETHEVDYKVIGRDTWKTYSKSRGDADKGDLRIRHLGSLCGALPLWSNSQKRAI